MENHDFNNAQFAVEDLLDFPNDDVLVTEGTLEASTGVNSGDSSNDINTVVDSCNSSFSGDVAGLASTEPDFSRDLCVPYNDMAELEWLSKFEEESFSSEDLQNLRLISGIKPRVGEGSSHDQVHGDEAQNNPTLFTSVPAKARSKRSHIHQGNWASRLLVKSPPSAETAANSSGGEGRRCCHCETDKTPQWRTGPEGPKTLCNACGVRYKSGRLVPEYRPAASPTFTMTKHSNSHRKVMELRRQKEVHRAHLHQHQHQQLIMNHHGMIFDVPNGDDYLIHHHVGPNYRQMI